MYKFNQIEIMQHIKLNGKRNQEPVTTTEFDGLKEDKKQRTANSKVNKNVKGEKTYE